MGLCNKSDEGNSTQKKKEHNSREEIDNDISKADNENDQIPISKRRCRDGDCNVLSIERGSEIRMRPSGMRGMHGKPAAGKQGVDQVDGGASGKGESGIHGSVPGRENRAVESDPAL